MEDRVRIRIDDAGVADVCLVRGDKMNALDIAMFDALVAATERLWQVYDAAHPRARAGTRRAAPSGVR